MPTYEFRCPDGHTFDRFFRKMSDAVLEVPCQVCGKPAGRQISGGSGLVFKGSGFYLTDYGKNAHRGESPNANKSSGDAAASGSDAKSSETKSAETKSETKSGAKAETKSSESAAPKPPTGGASTKSDK